MTNAPAMGAGLTRESLVRDLRALGIGAGEVLLVHASLRRVGWVNGGAAEVVAALREVLGEPGTLVVPTQTADNSDTSRQHLARIAGMSDDEIQRFRAAMPPFDAQTTSATGMGQIAEQVRCTPGAVRSTHPQTSFAALGPLAAPLLAGHAPDCHLGEESPLAQLYKAGARLLLLGVDYSACCAFHLGEYRYTATPPIQPYGCVVTANGRAQWRRYYDVVLDDSDFRDLGAAFEATGQVIRGTVGSANCRLADVVAAVDFATNWLAEHRQLPDSRLSQRASRPHS